MSDFEVHPRGTAEEIRLSRSLVAAITTEMQSYGSGLFPYAVEQAYNRLIETYTKQIVNEACE